MDPGISWAAPAPSPGKAKRLVLVIFQNGGSIDLDLFRQVRGILDVELPQDPFQGADDARQETEIDVWLHSSGGDANAAYKIALLLRSYASTLRVVVPDRAKSAATLIALAANEIYMARAAELGPLDAQIHYEPEGMDFSALDLVRSVDHVSQTALRFALFGGLAILDETSLSRTESLDRAVALSTRLHETLTQKIHPARILNAQSQLDATVDYAKALIEHRDADVEGGNDVVDVESLVKKYPSHGYVIDIEEASLLGLPAHHLCRYPGADSVKELHEHFERGERDTVTCQQHPRAVMLCLPEEETSSASSSGAKGD